MLCLFFFFNDTATTEIYTLSLHDALPICQLPLIWPRSNGCLREDARTALVRSEEHTSELQSPDHLVCRLLLEKKKQAVFKICVPQPQQSCHMTSTVQLPAP